MLSIFVNGCQGLLFILSEIFAKNIEFTFWPFMPGCTVQQTTQQ